MTVVATLIGELRVEHHDCASAGKPAGDTCQALDGTMPVKMPVALYVVTRFPVGARAGALILPGGMTAPEKAQTVAELEELLDTIRAFATD